MRIRYESDIRNAGRKTMEKSLSKRLQRIKRVVAKKGLKMNPCLSEETIAKFEKRSKVQLPLDYRSFLQVVGNGGDGPPYYGLLKLGEVPEDYFQSAVK